MKDVESIYDEQIAPLMAKIIKICTENKIPVAAHFQIGEGFFCTTSIFEGFGGDDDRFKKLVTIMKPKEEPLQYAGIAIMKGDDGKVTAQVTNSEGYSPAQLEVIKAELIRKQEAKDAAN